MASKSKEEGKRPVWEVETRREKVGDSKEARQLGAKVKETMNSAGQGAKRVIGPQAVKDARNTLVRDTREFAGATYSAARGKQSTGTRQSQEQSKCRSC
jgi:hypothetical protein